jgi:sulfonate dioxygenase
LEDLFYNPQAEVKDINPIIGAEVKGIQLDELGPEGKQQLALFVAQKQVVGEYSPSS